MTDKEQRKDDDDAYVDAFTKSIREGKKAEHEPGVCMIYAASRKDSNESRSTAVITGVTAIELAQVITAMEVLLARMRREHPDAAVLAEFRTKEEMAKVQQ